MQRWLADPDKQHYKPRRATAEKIAVASRRAATTKLGRQRAIRQAQDAEVGAAPSSEARLKVAWFQGPEEQYALLRTVNPDVPPELDDEMLDSFITDGEIGVMDSLRANNDIIYAMGDWYFGELESETIEGVL